MYTLVDEAEAKRYRSACANILTQTRDTLNRKYEINTQFTLVGSGARNLITRNGNGPYDLDYNLQIISMPQKYWDDLNNLKETVRRELNQAVGGTYFSDGHDSTVLPFSHKSRLTSCPSRYIGKLNSIDFKGISDSPLGYI